MIADSGHSRIPVYRVQKENIVGVLLTKSLLLIEGEPFVSQLPLRRLPIVDGNMLLYDLLNQFQTGKSHMAVVVDPADKMTILGIITLEDVIEELIQEEIYDETDAPIAAREKIALTRLSGENSPPDPKIPLAPINDENDVDDTPLLTNQDNGLSSITVDR